MSGDLVAREVRTYQYDITSHLPSWESNKIMATSYNVLNDFYERKYSSGGFEVVASDPKFISDYKSLSHSIVDVFFKQSEIYQWFVDHGIKDYRLSYRPDIRDSSYHLYAWIELFNDSDAMLFKLAWVGVE